jgi:hypothetical protein
MGEPERAVASALPQSRPLRADQPQRHREQAASDHLGDDRRSRDSDRSDVQRVRAVRVARRAGTCRGAVEESRHRDTARIADVPPLEAGRFLPRDLLATRIALRHGRLAALSSQGRAAANAPSVAARPTPDLMNSPRRRPAAQEGADNARPTDAARALCYSTARAGLVTLTVAGAFRFVRMTSGRAAFYRPPLRLQPRCLRNPAVARALFAQTNASPQPRRPSNPSGLLSAPGADVIFASRPGRRPAEQA